MIHSIKHLLHVLAYSWRSMGPRTLLGSWRLWVTDREAHNDDREFDRRFGTDTTTALTPHEAEIPRDRRDGATMYVPSVELDLAAMLAALGWSEECSRRATFIDIGSGKARIVFVAAMRTFREVVGIELSPVLHAVAERNLRAMAASGALASPVRLQLGDAAAIEVPDGPWIAYLYHPFREPVATLVMERLVATLATTPRPAAILYGHPTIQRPLDPTVFERDAVFQATAAGDRRTRNFRIGWTVWTNAAWLARHEVVEAVP